MNLSVEHVLLFGLVVCALYYLMGGCDCKEGIIIDDQGIPFEKFEGEKLCPVSGATGACYAYNQNCIYDESCKDKQNIGTGCIVGPNADMSKETRYPCRICRTDYNDLRGYKQCPENANDSNNSDVPFLPIIPDKIGGCAGSRYGCCANGRDFAKSSNDSCKQKKHYKKIIKNHKKHHKKHHKKQKLI